MTTLIKIILSLVIGTASIQAQEETTAEVQNILVTITDIKSDDGMVYIGLYDSEKTFLDKRYKSARSTIENNEAIITFANIPAGTYAVSVFHDENGNQKMDTNFMGIPKEDTGCSNNAKGFMSAPKWKDAKFDVVDSTVTLTINM